MHTGFETDKLTWIYNSFLVDSLGFSIYKIIESADIVLKKNIRVGKYGYMLYLWERIFLKKADS